ncbi:MAG: deoxyguanosinetriphosphate triphosphohydrolase [Candidatus Omnitrophica bacterium 4484_70.1]|nr:MAG: deoxyguanosinetriphosphate triphosphohydrolase [Candidatus Omnitrophica bacterium 4484_70.1]
MLTRKEIEEIEEKTLAPYATKSKYSRGRKHKEKEHPYRSVYQRDRDRIIHSAAFRRLEYKTQVFVYHEGDYYRTRLTHTLEVAQIARTISKALRLNEELTEAIALAHDIGHTPFGHAVEDTLNELMKEEGGFNHNIQGLRVVDLLEERYPHFKGLNLTWETREGIIKHSPFLKENKNIFLGEYEKEFEINTQPALEAQVMDIADEIAYDSHDLDDGLKSGMLEEEKLKKIEIWKYTEKKVKNNFTSLQKELKIYLIIRNLINIQVTDIIKSTLRNIKRLSINSPFDVKNYKKRIAKFSSSMQDLRKELREFLFTTLYSHWRVLRMSDKAKRFIKNLFYVYLNNHQLLPPNFKKRIERKEESAKRVICDYIAGMTDRYALEEYRKFFDPYEKI